VSAAVNPPSSSEPFGSFDLVEREPRLPDKVARAILERVVSGDFRPGHALPSERDLADQFGVSRTVVREALRSLSGKGLIDVRGGRGARVAAVDAQTVQDALRLFLWSSPIAYSKVHEVRWMVEVTAAGLAAERASASHLIQLKDAIATMQEHIADVEKATLEDLRFHRLIAVATGNEMFLILHDAIGDALLDVRRRNLALGPAKGRAVIKDHRAILTRIKARDSDGAREAMRTHLERVRLPDDAS
jgi:GntR family transcriptional repressor for pyruvate dehydrogenase complex